MPFFKSYPDDAGPGHVFKRYPDLYVHWMHMAEAIMNGPSPLTSGEREMIAAYVSAENDCAYCVAAHEPVAYESGITEGLVGQLVADFDHAPVDPKLKPLLAFCRKLMVTPSSMTQADADAVFAAGWDEKALHDAVAVVCRFAFMNRLVEAHGFIPHPPETARANAKRRVKTGYLDYYPDIDAHKEPAGGG